MGRYDNVRNLYRAMANMCKILKSMGRDADVPKIEVEYRKDIRKELKSANMYYTDPLEKSLKEGWRTVVDDDDLAVSGTDFRIVVLEEGEEWTDEEIEEFIQDEVVYPPIWEPWDCTGKRFTRWYTWRRQPVGIVMIHAWGTDL